MSSGDRGTGKGETVREERTSVEGDLGGSATPTRSKVESWEGRPGHLSPGRPHRWMVTTPATAREPGYRTPPIRRHTVTTAQAVTDSPLWTRVVSHLLLPDPLIEGKEGVWHVQNQID